VVLVVVVLLILDLHQAVLAQPIKVMQEKLLTLQYLKRIEVLAAAAALAKLVELTDADSVAMALLHP
jgi:hypothetical protein